MSLYIDAHSWYEVRYDTWFEEGIGQNELKKLSSCSCPRRGRNSTWSRSEQKDIAEDLKENGVVKKSRDSQRFRAKLADTRETNKEQN